MVTKESGIKSSIIDKLEALAKRYQELEHQMSTPEMVADYERLHSLAKERASLEDVVSLFQEYKRLQKEREGVQAVLSEADQEMVALAKEEMSRLDRQIGELETSLKLALLPKDVADERDVIVEIRAGTGGEEAGLFAADLFRMYSRYAAFRGWNVDVMNTSLSERGGFKEIVFEVRGKGAFSRLKRERGVHRVQRIPTTEASGRIHTSTATVAVLPEADEVEVQVNPSDLRIDIFHSSGHGGQNVQKVATAVRIVHIPTGIAAVCQDERSQLKNRQKAMAVLRARLYEMERRRQEEEIVQERRGQVGTGERAEKIRTYNFPQDRVTDHRIPLTLRGLPRLMDGELDPLLDALAAEEQARRLEEVLTA